MMQTGPVVTLKVAKFGASYHGLGALLSEPRSQRTAGRYTITIKPLSDICSSEHNSDLLLPHEVDKSCVRALGDPGTSEPLHGSSRRKKEQIMQRNRQLYRSNPNVTGGSASISISYSAAGHVQS